MEAVGRGWMQIAWISRRPWTDREPGPVAHDTTPGAGQRTCNSSRSEAYPEFAGRNLNR